MQSFPVIIHPAYLSMYILVAIIILVGVFSEECECKLAGELLISVLISWFWFFIILLQSKAGLIIASFVFLINAVLAIISTRKYFQIIISLFVIFGGYYLETVLLLPQIILEYIMQNIIYLIKKLTQQLLNPAK